MNGSESTISTYRGTAKGASRGTQCVDQVAGLEADPVARRHAGHHVVLAELRRDGDHGCGRDVGMGEQHLLDLPGRDVLAAAPDRVLEAVDEPEVAVGLADHAVARVEPEVSPRRDRLLGHLPVAGREGERLVGPHHELARLAVGDLGVVLVDDARGEAGHDAPHRAGTLLAVARPEHDVRLGHAVALDDLDPEALAERRLELGRCRRGERDAHAMLPLLGRRLPGRQDRDHGAE